LALKIFERRSPGIGYSGYSGWASEIQLSPVENGGKHPLILDGFLHVSTILLVAQDFATIHSRVRLDVERILIAYIIESYILISFGGTI
jgi:hypothetical protein